MPLPAPITAVYNDLYVIEVATDPINADLIGKSFVGFGEVVEGPSTSPIAADGTFVWFARTEETPCVSYGGEQYYFVAGSALLFNESALP